MTDIRWGVSDRWVCQEKGGKQMEASNGRGPKGHFGPMSKIAMQGLDLVRTTGITEEEAAEQLGIRVENIQRTRHVLARRPDLEPLLRTGDLSLYEAQKVAGLRATESRRPTKDRGDGKGLDWQPGRGDRWDDFRYIAMLYLRAQEKRGMIFAHVPPKAARKRIDEVDEIIDLLSRMRADLEPRSHPATLSAPRT